MVDTKKKERSFYSNKLPPGRWGFCFSSVASIWCFQLGVQSFVKDQTEPPGLFCVNDNHFAVECFLVYNARFMITFHLLVNVRLSWFEFTSLSLNIADKPANKTAQRCDRTARGDGNVLLHSNKENSSSSSQSCFQTIHHHMSSCFRSSSWPLLLIYRTPKVRQNGDASLHSRWSWLSLSKCFNSSLLYYLPVNNSETPSSSPSLPCQCFLCFTRT